MPGCFWSLVAERWSRPRLRCHPPRVWSRSLVAELGAQRLLTQRWGFARSCCQGCAAVIFALGRGALVAELGAQRLLTQRWGFANSCCQGCAAVIFFECQRLSRCESSVVVFPLPRLPSACPLVPPLLQVLVLEFVLFRGCRFHCRTLRSFLQLLLLLPDFRFPCRCFPPGSPDGAALGGRS